KRDPRRARKGLPAARDALEVSAIFSPGQGYLAGRGEQFEAFAGRKRARPTKSS
ncbi:hypothetical protein A2U01_0060098, partial [Trifolium medium]|nr:hypothetical protein [Trifolium medium]